MIEDIFKYINLSYIVIYYVFIFIILIIEYV